MRGYELLRAERSRGHLVMHMRRNGRGWCVCGDGTVWRYYPSGERCPTSEEQVYAAFQKRWAWRHAADGGLDAEKEVERLKGQLRECRVERARLAQTLHHWMSAEDAHSAIAECGCSVAREWRATRKELGKGD